MNTQNTETPTPAPAPASMRRPAWRRGLLATTLTAGVLLAAGCAAPAEDGAAENTAPATAATTTASPTAATSTPANPTGTTATAAAVTVADPWARATEEQMTAVFGELTNTTDEELTVVGASSEAAGMTELHEMVDDGSGEMVMRELEGGFTIPAGETHTLEPGGDHVMLMDLPGPIEPGQEVPVTLQLSDGSEVILEAVGRDFAGANESYAPGHGESDGSSATPSVGQSADSDGGH